MLLSVHLAPLTSRAASAALRPRPSTALWAETALTVPLAAGVPPCPDGVGLLAAWPDDAALDAFLAEHPLARRLDGGWHVRLQPLRASGAWSALPGLARDPRSVADEEPVAVVTLGRLRLRRAAPFLRASAAAERQPVADPALLASTAFARPPRLVATFSLWRTAAEMEAYAYGAAGEEHLAAIRAHRTRSFHHESVFARFRPYGIAGAAQRLDGLRVSAAAAA